MPTRYLRPGICDSDSINACSPMAEVLFYRLLVNVDDFGRFDARPILVKSKCFPIREEITTKQVEDLLIELGQCGLIVLYQSGDKTYLQMQKWDNQPRAKESKFPPFGDNCIRLHTNVCIPHTNLPGTETETGTVTETETGTGVRGKNAKPAKFNPPAFLAMHGVTLQVSEDWLKLRKLKKAAVTQTAIDGIQREAMKADIDLDAALRVCCERGWTGFKAEWFLSAPNPTRKQFLTPHQQREENNRRATQEWLEEMGVNPGAKPNDIEGSFTHD